MNAPRAGDGRQDGMILIVVLWAVSLMTLAVVAISALSQKSISVAGAETDRLRSEMALEAGIAAGEGLILATAPDGRALLDGTPLVIDVGFGRKVEVRVRDASGLVDINRADLKMIEGLIAGLDIDPLAGAALFAAIRELRPEEPETATDGSSGDNSPQQQPQADAGQPAQNGIIPNDQSGGGPGGQTAKPPVFASVGQLYGLKGASPPIIDTLLPLITLYSTAGGKVNPMAAPVDVLRAIPGFSDAQVAVLENAQKTKQWQVPEVQSLLNEAERFVSVGEPRSFVVVARVVGGPGVIAGNRLEASVIVDESGKEAFQVLAWSW